MPGPFSPNDSLVGPIVHQLATDIQTQIPSISYVYEKLPERTPGDNSVVIPLAKLKVVSDTNGKLKVRLYFAIQHLFLRSNIADNLARAYTYIQPWLYVLSAWGNQNLGGLAMEVDVSEVQVKQMSMAGQPLLALLMSVEVLTEFNIPLT